MSTEPTLPTGYQQLTAAEVRALRTIHGETLRRAGERSDLVASIDELAAAEAAADSDSRDLSRSARGLRAAAAFLIAAGVLFGLAALAFEDPGQGIASGVSFALLLAVVVADIVRDVRERAADRRRDGVQ